VRLRSSLQPQCYAAKNILMNEDCNVLFCVGTKSMTKKQQKGWEGKQQKDHARPERTGIFAAGDVR
jgi:hypothetical protein